MTDQASEQHAPAPVAVDARARRALLATCVAAAARAGETIRAMSSDRAAIRWENKARADFVSEVDRSSERAIAALIDERHPGARVLGEELSPTMHDRSGLVFVVDPLDGTTNFLHDFPWYAVSIAALVDDVLEAGAVLNVPTGELFTATRGGGARRNGQPIRVSANEDPLRSLVGTGFPFKVEGEAERYLRALPAIMAGTAGIRRPGAAALDLADVACGRFEGFWELSLAPWDVAAGILLIREAGGTVTDLVGGDARVAQGGFVAGNASMHAWLLDILSRSHTT